MPRLKLSKNLSPESNSDMNLSLREIPSWNCPNKFATWRPLFCIISFLGMCVWDTASCNQKEERCSDGLEPPSQSKGTDKTLFYSSLHTLRVFLGSLHGSRLLTTRQARFKYGTRESLSCHFWACAWVVRFDSCPVVVIAPSPPNSQPCPM